MRELVAALIDASPVPCVPGCELELPAYYDSSQQTIFVKKEMCIRDRGIVSKDYTGLETCVIEIPESIKFATYALSLIHI